MAEGQWFALGSGDPAFRMTEVREHYWEGSIAIPPGVEAVTDSILVEFSFMVEGGWEGSGAGRGDAEGRRGEEGRITVPLVVPRWAPENPGPQTFRARVRIPPGFTVTGSFPTSVLRRPRPGEEGIYEMALQGLPSMLILRVSPGGGAGMTLERGLDVLVILLLLVMAALGWRYLRRNVG